MKLVKIDVVRSYELTYLLPASYTDSELTKCVDEVTALLQKYKATNIQTQPWGKKKLAYKIKQGSTVHSDGQYYHVTFQAPSLVVQGLEKDIFLYNKIFRHLLLVVGDVDAVAEKPAKAAKSSKKSEKEEVAA
jgi:ribosomal protein S6